METEMTLAATDVIEILAILEEERAVRIRHGDGPIEAIDRVIEALGEADRIVIQ